MIVEQLCKFIKNYLTVHLKQVNSMVDKSYLNKAVKMFNKEQRNKETTRGVPKQDTVLLSIALR